MTDFSINEMLGMQKRLQDKYKDKWEKISYETGKNKLLWMIGEIGEVMILSKKTEILRRARILNQGKTLLKKWLMF